MQGYKRYTIYRILVIILVITSLYYRYYYYFTLLLLSRIKYNDLILFYNVVNYY